MMSPNLFYQDFLLCIGVASLIFGLFLLFFKAPANNIYQPYRRSKSLLAAGYLVMSLNIMFWGITFDDRFTKPDVLDIYNEIIAIYLLYIIFQLCALQSSGPSLSYPSPAVDGCLQMGGSHSDKRLVNVATVREDKMGNCSIHLVPAYRIHRKFPL